MYSSSKLYTRHFFNLKVLSYHLPYSQYMIYRWQVVREHVKLNGKITFPVVLILGRQYFSDLRSLRFCYYSILRIVKIRMRAITHQLENGEKRTVRARPLMGLKDSFFLCPSPRKLFIYIYILFFIKMDLVFVCLTLHINCFYCPDLLIR